MNVVFWTATLVLADAFSAFGQETSASTPTSLSQLLAGSPALQHLETALANRIRYHPATILCVTRERWAQIGITIQFLIVVRTLGEVFRLKHVLGANFGIAIAMSYVGGALIAACFCWAGVTFYFFRRYTLSFWIAPATVIILLVYKIAVIG